MDSQGNIYRMGQEPESVKQVKEKMTMLNALEAAELQLLKAEHRHEVLRGLRSKNHSAKRRAKKKIADASRRRNRR